MFIYIFFLLPRFDQPLFSFDSCEFSHSFVEGPHIQKDASTFVLVFCSLFTMHNNRFHLFDFICYQSNLQKWFPVLYFCQSPGVTETDRRGRDEQRQLDRKLTATKADSLRSKKVLCLVSASDSLVVEAPLPAVGRPLRAERLGLRCAERGKLGTAETVED